MAACRADEEARALAAFRRKFECDLRVFADQAKLLRYVRRYSSPPTIGPDGVRAELTPEAYAERKIAFVRLLAYLPESCEVGEVWQPPPPHAEEEEACWTMHMPGGISKKLRGFGLFKGKYTNRKASFNHAYYHGIFEVTLGRQYAPHATPFRTAPMTVYQSQLITAHVFLYQYGRRPGELHHLGLPAFAHFFKNTGGRTCDFQRKESAQLLRVLQLLARTFQIRFDGEWGFVHCVLAQFLKCTPAEPNGRLALELMRLHSRNQIPVQAYSVCKRPHPTGPSDALLHSQGHIIR